MKTSFSGWILPKVAHLAANPVGALVVRIVVDVARSDITDRSMTLAAQLFTSLLPVIILLSTMPGADYIDAGLSHLDLTSADLALAATAPSTTSFATFGVFGALMTLASATSFSRATNRMYASVWQVPRLRLRDWWRWVAVLGLMALSVVAQGYALLLRRIPVVGAVVTIAATFLLWSLCWWAVAKISVKRSVPGRRLLLTGALTGVGLTALLTGSYLSLPRVLRTAVDEFGTLGIIFTVIGWLFLFFYVVVTAAVIAHAIAPGDHDRPTLDAKESLLQSISQVADAAPPQSTTSAEPQ